MIKNIFKITERTTNFNRTHCCQYHNTKSVESLGIRLADRAFTDFASIGTYIETSSNSLNDLLNKYMYLHVT